MRFPVLAGTIDRRIFVNYRVVPEVLSRLVPQPFAVQLVHGWGIAGICLIRLTQLRPQIAPAFAGRRRIPWFTSENAVHRVGVEWEEGADHCMGVYVPRGDSSSRMSPLVGALWFPGVRDRAHFTVVEGTSNYSISMESHDGKIGFHVAGHVTSTLASSSVFSSVEEAARFFERGSVGYAAAPVNRRRAFNGLELRAETSRIVPLAADELESSWFDDPSRFPPGSVAFDSAFLMRGVEHEWHHRAAVYSPLLEPLPGRLGMR